MIMCTEQRKSSIYKHTTTKGPFHNMTIIQFQFSKSFIEEKFEDTKRMIRSCKSKNRQCDGQKKKNYMTNNELQVLHRKLKIEEHELHLKMNFSALEG